MNTLTHFVAVAVLLGASLSQPSATGAPGATNPQMAAALYAQSGQALRRNQPREALRLLSRCLLMDPRHCGCLRSLGEVNRRPDIKQTDAAITFIQRYVDSCADKEGVADLYEFMSTLPPRTPKGLPRCTNPLSPARPLPARVGETLRYHVDVNGISMGIIDFKIEQKGTFEAVPVAEYRASFKIDSLVASFLPVEGRAASLVPLGTYIPARAMNRLQVRDHRIEEDLVFAAGGRQLTSDHERDGKSKKLHRRYLVPSLDLLTAFYGLRSLARDARGCAAFYGNANAHTVWVEPEGSEKIDTPVGIKTADKYFLRYATEVSRKTHEGRIWLSQDKSRLPYLAVVEGKDRMEVRIHLFDPGQPDGVY